MRFTLSKKLFAAALKAVHPAVPTRPGVPVLGCVRIDASADGLSLRTTDLELTVERRITEGVSVRKHGSAAVPAKVLGKAVSVMPEENLTFESTGDDVRSGLDLRAGSRIVTLRAYSPEDWPAGRSESDLGAIARVQGAALADALVRAAVCASQDDLRPVLTGVALVFQEGSRTLEVVATDSYRLGLIEVSLTEAPSAPVRPPLIPSRIAKTLAKQLKGVREGVRLVIEEAPDGGESLVRFAWGDTVWTARAIEGEFPNWRQVIPEPEGGLLDADAGEFESALTAAASVRTGTSAPIRLSLDRTCTLTLDEVEVGTLTEELEDATFDPDGVGALEVAFNPDYLLDGVRFIGEERVRMWLRDGLKPGLLEGSDRRYAVMPIRLP